MGDKFLTPKAIANKIKAKGLQKLRWYCELCQKQCRDENGFKCHCMSESHLRQMAVFRDNPTALMDEFSREFEKTFMEIMKRKGGKRVRANTVYQEVIQDRHHIHMNATMWPTLTDFVVYLGKQGLCTVDQTEEGWFVQYIDRDPRVLARQAELEKQAQQSIDEEARAAMRIQHQVEEARKAEEEARKAGIGVHTDTAPVEMKERSEEEKITFALGGSAAAASDSAAAVAAPAAAALPAARSTPVAFGLARPAVPSVFGSSTTTTSYSAAAAGVKRKHATSTLDALMAENERLKTQRFATADEQASKKAKADSSSTAASTSSAAPSSQQRYDYWLFPHLVVKIMNKKLLNGSLYKTKGVVQRVQDRYIAEVKLLDSNGAYVPQGTIIRIDQAELETVIPAKGKSLLVVNGPYRGQRATLVELHEADYNASIHIEGGKDDGKIVHKVEYEDICKLYEE